MYSEVNSALAALFPRCCILCGQACGCRSLCAGCHADLPWILAPCSRCGGPLAAEQTGSLVEPDAGICPRCTISWTVVDRAWSALVYEYPVDRLVTWAKFQARTECASVLGELLGTHLRRLRNLGALTTPGWIVPVPLHPHRLATRGFNQALEIAQPVSRCLHIPIRTSGCARVRNTVQQTALTGTARRRNLRGAFRVSADLSGQSVAIVDDVLTTGSTVEALAEGLRKAGATGVQVWSVARTVRDSR